MIYNDLFDLLRFYVYYESERKDWRACWEQDLPIDIHIEHLVVFVIYFAFEH